MALSLVAVACGGDDAEPTPTPTPAPTEPAVGADGQIAIVPAGGDFAVGTGVHIPFVALSLGGDILVNVEDVTFLLFADAVENPTQVASGLAVQTVPGAGEVHDHVHSDGSLHEHGGEEEGRGFFYATVDLDRSGIWGLVVQGMLEDGTAVQGQMSFSVAAESAVPAVGDAAIASVNLTKDDVDDLSIIDSGTVPNDMHDLTIKESLDAGRPLVVVFSTPGFCQTQFCGPVTEEVEALQDEYSDTVDFIHIEIWTDRTINEVNPTAIEWLQQEDGSLTEPWVYVVDHNGIIFDRFEGPAARNILEPSVKAVSEGATFQ